MNTEHLETFSPLSRLVQRSSGCQTFSFHYSAKKP